MQDRHFQPTRCGGSPLLRPVNPPPVFLQAFLAEITRREGPRKLDDPYIGNKEGKISTVARVKSYLFFRCNVFCKQLFQQVSFKFFINRKYNKMLKKI